MDVKFPDPGVGNFDPINETGFNLGILDMLAPYMLLVNT